MRAAEQKPNSSEENRDMWYDPDTGSIGWGKTYGEHSFNNRPVNARPLKEYFEGKKPRTFQLRRIIKIIFKGS